MTDKFRNKNGDLSLYAFACGYIQKKQTPSGEFSLFLDGTVWHVQASNENGRFIWETFDYLTLARQFFNKQK